MNENLASSVEAVARRWCSSWTTVGSCDSHANDADVIGEQSRSVYKRRSQGQRGELKGVFLPPTEREDTFFGSEASVVNIPAGPGARPTMIQSFQSIHHTLLAFLTSHYCHVRAISCHHVALLHFSYAFRTFVSHLWPGPDPKSRLHYWCSEALNERDTLSLLHRSRGL